MGNEHSFIIAGCLIPGLVLIIIGIAFLRDRIRYIKSGHIAIATLFKQVTMIDNENDTFYIPFFTFTSYSNKEIIYEYRSTQSKNRWTIGDKIKVVYKEGLSDSHEILRLCFYDAFLASASLLAAGILLLFIAGTYFCNASEDIAGLIIPTVIILFLSFFNLWAIRFFKSLE